MSFFHTNKSASILPQQIITTFYKMVGIINLRYLILIIGHIDIHPILELLTNLISPAH